MDDIKDILHDWLMDAGSDNEDLKYLEILQNSQEDINPNHWKQFESFGRFIHFINIYTGEVL